MKLEISQRFKDADWFQETPPLVTIGGVGGIGSYLAFLLARQNVVSICYDFDIIETHNIGGQLYKTTDIGLHKVTALKKLTYELTGLLINDHNSEFTSESHLTPIAFSAFDSMKARKTMFEKWKTLENKEIFIDGRMNAEQGQIYFVTPDKIEAYEKTLFGDEEVEDLPCTYKSTSYCANIIAALMVSGFNNHRSNILTGNNVKEVPFEVHYMLQLFNFKIN